TTYIDGKMSGQKTNWFQKSPSNRNIRLQITRTSKSTQVLSSRQYQIVGSHCDNLRTRLSRPPDEDLGIQEAEELNHKSDPGPNNIHEDDKQPFLEDHRYAKTEARLGSRPD
ncbi:hypothetical protein C922_04851, partial [Plasmodium inui San Antonio 1]